MLLRNLGGYGHRLIGNAHVQLCLKGGLAAALSWVVAHAVTAAIAGNAFGHYVYYAPLGAVVAASPTIADSARTARQSALALVLGAALGLTAHQTLDPNAWTLAMVVGAGIAVSALPGIGEQRSWVPIVALFVLVIGDDHPTTYAAAYVGLTALGGLCGVLVNLVLPSTRLRQGRAAVEGLRQSIARQLDDLADALRQPTPLTPADWRTHRNKVAPDVERTRGAIEEMIRAQRANPRGSHHMAEVTRQHEGARALERIAALVEDLPEMLSQISPEAARSVPLDADLAAVLGDGLTNLAALVRGYQPDLSSTDPRLRALESAVQRLTAEFGRRRDLEAADLAMLGAVVANVRSSLEAVGRS